jgi:hypothetical protein
LLIPPKAISNGSHDPFLILGDVQGNGYLSKYTSFQLMLNFRFFPTLHRLPPRSPSTPSSSPMRLVLAGPILRYAARSAGSGFSSLPGSSSSIQSASAFRPRRSSAVWGGDAWVRRRGRGEAGGALPWELPQGGGVEA